ncbi:NAD(P)-dependent oxidoreductase [Myxococcota bacterium]|nr:NAD(P)-dependent oxidoreductase [Myxococcota bacterium]
MHGPTSESVRTVGIVGAGTLGRGISERLLDRGFEVSVYDPRGEATEGLEKRGARVCPSNRELASHSELICVWVQNDEQCREALLGDEGVLAGAGSNAAIAIHSTVHPGTVTDLAGAASRQKIPLIDAPVAGQGVMSLERGDFWMLGGGDESVLERFRSVAETFCERLLHCGPLGTGAIVKLSHNVATYTGYLAIVEAQTLARAAGVREGVLESVAEASGTLSDAMQLMLQSRDRRERDLPEAFSDERMRVYADILQKDLRVAMEVAAEHGVTLNGAANTASLADFIYGLEGK